MEDNAIESIIIGNYHKLLEFHLNEVRRRKGRMVEREKKKAHNWLRARHTLHVTISRKNKYEEEG